MRRRWFLPDPVSARVDSYRDEMIIVKLGPREPMQEVGPSLVIIASCASGSSD
jgi:hypothetical protein